MQSVAEAVPWSTAGDSENWLLRKSTSETALWKVEEICFVPRRRGTKRAEIREGFEFERVASCGDVEQWWRTKLDFCSGEPFGDHHWSTTLGAAPEMVRARGVLIGLRLLGCAEQLKAKRQESGTSPVG
jgi:hypothetical protein